MMEHRREKVIKGLELCRYDPDPGQELKYDHSCKKCPYNGDGAGKWCAMMYMDALALLKAQEPVEPIQGRDDQDEDIFCCGVCGAVVGETYLGPPGECEVRDNYCPECGRAVKWDV